MPAEIPGDSKKANGHSGSGDPICCDRSQDLPENGFLVACHTVLTGALEIHSNFGLFMTIAKWL